LLSPSVNPFGGDNHETKNEFFQSEGWLYKIQLFTDEIGQKMVKISTDGHHDQEHGVFMKKREWHLFPKKIIVHLIKQPFAIAPVVIVKARTTLCPDVKIFTVGFNNRDNSLVERPAIHPAVLHFYSIFAQYSISSF